MLFRSGRTGKPVAVKTGAASEQQKKPVAKQGGKQEKKTDQAKATTAAAGQEEAAAHGTYCRWCKGRHPWMKNKPSLIDRCDQLAGLDVSALLTTLRSRNWCERCGNREAARCNCGRTCDRCTGAHMPRFHDLMEGTAQANVVQVEPWLKGMVQPVDRKSTRLNSSHSSVSRMPSSA